VGAHDGSSNGPEVTVETLSQATQVGTNDAGQTLFSCQATEVLRATKGPLNWWEPRQYVEDLTSGNSTVKRVVRALLVGLFNRFQKAIVRFLPRFSLIQGGKRYPSSQEPRPQDRPLATHSDCSQERSWRSRARKNLRHSG
jgi:hypothetical protein